MTVEAAAAEALLTEEAPEHGCLGIFDVILSSANRWMENGVHVIRSTEFELVGEGESLQDAVQDFVGHAIDYQSYLATLIEREEATEHEIRVAGQLGPRLARAYEATARHLNDGLAEAIDRRRRFETPLFTLHWGRRRSRQPAHVWHPSPNTSKQLSRA
jgi:hypothetical protein